jgi:methylated-DNA-protein-cysteine methyltransferase related protein
MVNHFSLRMPSAIFHAERSMSRRYPPNNFVSILPPGPLKRRILRDGASPNQLRDAAFRRTVLAIPAGRVSTYGKVAAAAGYSLYHRAVARLLRTDPPGLLPWHRVVGAGGEIKLRYEAAEEQRLRLKLEGVAFHGKRVDMDLHEHQFRVWERNT